MCVNQTSTVPKLPENSCLKPKHLVAGLLGAFRPPQQSLQRRGVARGLQKLYVEGVVLVCQSPQTGE